MALAQPAHADVTDDWTAAVAADRVDRVVALSKLPLHVLEGTISDGALVGRRTRDAKTAADVEPIVHELAKSLVGRVRLSDDSFQLVDGRQLRFHVDEHHRVRGIDLLIMGPGI